MNSVTRKQRESAVTMQRNALLVALLCMVIVLIVMCVRVTGGGHVEIRTAPTHRVDATTIANAAEVILHKLLSRTGFETPEQDARMLCWVAPSYKSFLVDKLAQSKKKILAKKISFSWEQTGISSQITDAAHVKVHIVGDLSSYIPTRKEGRQLIRKVRKSYLLHFAVKGGETLLENITEEEEAHEAKG
ncbi:MAG: TraE/TraK family type IV conjugative transfer system protein [Simkaniaceae bacterium]|nr:TraE/TraK family type IV conjugative transfer system protein [Simkaniaceae bacterium]